MARVRGRETRAQRVEVGRIFNPAVLDGLEIRPTRQTKPLWYGQMRLWDWVTDWLRRVFPPKTLGQRGEAAAARYLKRLGYKILARGERKGPGELDLVAVDGRTIVFVEVKTRRSSERGHPVEAVDAAKQRRLTRLAVTYLKRRHLLEYPARFDVVAVTWPEGQRHPTVEHFPNAFEAVGQGEFYS